MEADFPNPDGLVLAGQFARIRAHVGDEKDAILVPQRSIIELQGNFSVFVVGSQGEVEQRKVEVGAKIDQLQIITSGLKPGEQVVLEGVQRVKSGMTIKPRLTDFDETQAASSTNSPEV
ncbi:MAG: hypothetical protein DRR06_20365 [Gammaproteobacteria bacterium]|nr:MAG: hypothetical protein DRR06_20365 [Gammaproteobacteria bacterium]